ncbi:hypothetical protein PGB90_008778 [Kerria lacca]
MSHTVTVTRTTTTTSTSAIILNTGYCKTVPGILKIAEIIIAGIIMGLLFVAVERYDLSNYLAIKFFQYIVVSFFIGSLLLFLGCLVSISTGSIIAKTSYEFIYHGGAFILYTIATLWLIIRLRDFDYDYYKYYHISSILGIVNSVLYCVSCVFAYKSYRWP